MIQATFSTPYGIDGNCVAVSRNEKNTNDQIGEFTVEGWISEAAKNAGAHPVPGCSFVLKCQGNNREKHTNEVWKRLKYVDIDLSYAEIETILIDGKIMFGDEIVDLSQE